MIRRLIFAIITALACCGSISATPVGDEPSQPQNTLKPRPGMKVKMQPAVVEKPQPKEQKKSAPRQPEKIKVRFAWGGDFGASIDMTGNEMSSIDFDIAFGIKRGWLNFLGVGAQADINVANSCRSYPLFLLFRTNFTDRPTRCFWELKGGASLNFLEHNHRQTGIYGSTGIGVKLAEGRKFSSHLVLAYTFLQRRTVVGTEMTHYFKDLHFASVRLGIVF